MLKLIAGIASLLVAATSLVVPAAPVPRTSPEFAIVSPSGQSVQLSAFKGKVVVMEFLFVKSEHCLRVLRTLGKLQGELGSRGFQPVGVVFDPPNTSVDGRRLAATMQDYFKLTFPVGYSSKEDVDRYLGRTRQEILSIPQVIVIDRSGTIRAASGGRSGDLTLEDESSLRDLIGKLLDENH